MTKKIKGYVFGRIERFKSLSKTKKTYIIIFLSSLCFYPSKVILEWRGRDFPLKSELQYSEGILDYGGYGITLKSIKDSREKTVFSCHYTAFTTRDSGSCMDFKYIEPYLDKPAKIGWYYQKDFLGFNNSLPQLVSLEVDGEKIKYYEKTVKINKNINTGSFVISFSMSIILTLIFTKIIYRAID